ncbi:MAG: hypothetical protein IJU75_04790 [Clostridia bacterium]|nr:hypothetical protein [Clostridia bacterium]
MKKTVSYAARFTALVLALLMCAGAMTGCVYKLIFGSSGAKLFGEKVKLSRSESLGHLSYPAPEGFRPIEGPYGSSITYEMKDEDEEVAFYVQIEKHSVLLSFSDMEEDAALIDEDDVVSTYSAKHNGTKWAFIRFTGYDDVVDGYVEYTVCYGTYDRMGVREWYKILFCNTEENGGFVDAFMKKTKIS